jgi:hypothetical protein
MEDRRIEGSFSQGWPIAIFVTLLAVAAYVSAGMINKATYRRPTDPTAPSRSEAPR